MRIYRIFLAPHQSAFVDVEGRYIRDMGGGRLLVFAEAEPSAQAEPVASYRETHGFSVIDKPPPPPSEGRTPIEFGAMQRDQLTRMGLDPDIASVVALDVQIPVRYVHALEEVEHARDGLEQAQRHVDTLHRKLSSFFDVHGVKTLTVPRGSKRRTDITRHDNGTFKTETVSIA